MGKIITILFLTFFITPNLFAKPIFINCIEDKFIQDKRSFIFEIDDRKKDIILVAGISVKEDKKNIKKFSKDSIELDYDGIIAYKLGDDMKLIPDDENYISFSINRITGKMLYVMNQRDSKKPKAMESYTCSKAEAKF
jgi:hypothetical protein